jgi:hypothetical protein
MSTAHNTQPDDESLMISPADQRLLFARLYKPHLLLPPTDPGTRTHVGLATGGISDTLSKDQVLKGAGARSRHCCANSARTVEEPARSALMAAAKESKPDIDHVELENTDAGGKGEEKLVRVHGLVCGHVASGHCLTLERVRPWGHSLTLDAGMWP